MTGETIGTARVDIVVNTEEFTAGIATMDRATKGMAQSVEQSTKRVADSILKTNAAAKTVGASANVSSNAIEQNSKRQIASLTKLASTFGLTREEMIRYRIETQTTGAVQKELLAKLDASVARMKAQGREFNQFGLSAKAQAAALRGLPAQITDIVTGLASGQRPLTILFQQGGQLKDMFGGIVPAARALGGAVAGLVNPFTLAAGAVAGLAVAWNKAEGEAAAFNRAIALTGQGATLSVDKLRSMARELAAQTGETEGAASAALAQVAASGQFTVKQMQQVTEAALLMQRATGRSIKETVEDFASLQKDPVEGILKLNEAIGDGTKITGFLTQETANQIERLKEQGREADATSIAFNALYKAINERAPEAQQSLTTLGDLTHNIAKEARGAGDAFVGMFRSFDNGLKGFLNSGFARFTIRPLLPLSQDFGQPPAGKKLNPRIGKDFQNVTGGSDTIADSQTEREVIAFRDKYLTREENKKKALAELDRLRLHYTQQEYDILKKGIEERFKPPKTPNNGIEQATAKNRVQAFEDELKKEQGLIANESQVLEANYAARNISAAQYYAEQKRLAQENTDVQVKALEGEIAVLQSRNVKGKISIENATELAQKEAALAKVRADGAAAQKVLNIQEEANAKQRQQALKSYGDALKETEIAQQDEIDNQILRLTVGEREYEQRTRIIALRRQEAKELRDLARQKTLDPINVDVYDQQARLVEESFDRQVRAAQRGYDLMTKAQQDWASGALKAFADYRDAANDVAGQTYGIFSDALHGLEDVLTDFFTKGKADWKGFFDGIAAEITRFIIRQQLNKLIQKFIPGMSGGDGDSASALSGAASSLAASAGPLYGAAAALNASAAALAAAGTGSGLTGSTGGSSGSGGWLQTLFGLFTGGGEQWYAKGGAFSKGAEVKAFAYGGVVGSPTYFPMAGGKMGLMGEEKPEAIMPLKRGPDGRLGVVAELPRRNANTTNISITVPVQGHVDTRTKLQVGQETARQVRRSARN